jgi:hypothetical protein
MSVGFTGQEALKADVVKLHGGGHLDFRIA